MINSWDVKCLKKKKKKLIRDVKTRQTATCSAVLDVQCVMKRFALSSSTWPSPSRLPSFGLGGGGYLQLRYLNPCAVSPGAEMRCDEPLGRRSERGASARPDADPCGERGTSPLTNQISRSNQR